MTGPPLDRRPAFWIAYAVLAAASLVLAWRLFPLAIPLVNLDITMTREAAIAEAQALAKRYELAPAGARHAIVFNQDGRTQSYVELEGGGKAAFARLVEGKAYAPYWWDVRLFQPGVVDEVVIRFKPDGTRNGFQRRVEETYVRDRASMALTPDAALELARTRAAADWGIDFAPYRLLDQSQQTRPSGRVDHLFVFERAESLGEARIRLALTVTGDELTGVNPYVHVPESFDRRYQEMRSANNAIAGVASIAAGVLYGLGGCILGALWLLRRHYLVWKPALAAGLVVGALLGAASLANAQTAWFVFNTAQDESVFWIRQVGTAMLLFVGGGIALGEVFMASEGLVRRAFPDHPQLWRVWSREAAATRAIAGRTAGGYLFVPLELALIATFYFLTNRYLGWWQPSEQLTDPNILASAVPALAPIGMALQAGMLEECLFRGVPLALGALIGAHYGHRRAGIAVAFVLQAVIFGAAHANYPGFPSYSRLVELLVPSLLWAAIFLRYGLVPTILLHALFDLVLMSIPLFLIDAPGASLQRAIVIAAGLLPLAVVVVRMARAAGLGALPGALRNGGWQATVPVPPATVAPRARAGGVDTRAALFQRSLPVLGLLGLAAWFAFTPLRADAPPLAIGRDAAIAAAVEAVEARGAKLGPQWRRFALPRSALDDGNQRQWHAFVWREAGPAAYRSLVGTALAPPMWEVRLARFDGDVADRAEEWRVAVTGDGHIRQVSHRVPEGRPGASLTRDEALALVERTLTTQLGSDPAALVMRGADTEKRPARRDWVFSFADPRANVGKGGEARLQVALAGDEVVSAGRSLFIPEAWKRSEVERDGQRLIMRVAGGGLIVVLGLAALVYAVSAWNKGRCDRRALLASLAFLFAMLLVAGANNWPVQAFALRTAEPLTTQLLITGLALLAGGLLAALVLALLAGVGAYYAREHAREPLAGRFPPWAVGVFAALATAGVAAALSALVPPPLPTWPDLAHRAAWSPLLAAAISGLALVPGVAVTLFLLAAFDRLTAGWSRRVLPLGVVVIVIGVAVQTASGGELVQTVPQGALEGLTSFVIAWLVLRHDLRTVPAFVAVGLALGALRAASIDATPTGWASFAITALVAAGLAFAVTRYLGANRPAAGIATGGALVR